MSEKSADRTTDSLLHPGQGHSPSYGVNEDEDESVEGGGIALDVRHSKERIWTMGTFSLIACIGTLVNGMSLGYSTNTLAELSDLYSDGDHLYGIEKDSSQASLFGAFLALGAIFGGPVAWPLTEAFGRKTALLFSTVPALIGWIALAVSNLLPNRSGFLAFMYIGRLVTGFSAGWISFCVPVYIAEISTSKWRGRFGNCNQLFITIGIFLVETLGFKPKSFLKYTEVGLIAAGFITIFAFLLLFVRETPSWLYKKGKDLEGNRTLNFLRGPKANIPKEIRGIKSVLADTRDHTILEQLKALKYHAAFHPFILILLLMFFQQFSGINAAIFYSTQVFTSANISNPALVTLLAVGLVQIFATFVSVLLVDHLGRKTLLIISSAGMSLSSAGLGVYFFIFESYCDSNLGGSGDYDLNVCHSTNFGILAIASVVVFILSFSLGWGPIPWTMMSELVPLKVRALTNSIAIFFNWAFAFVITLGFNKYANGVTDKFAWWTFTVVMLVGIFVVLFFYPETKGQRLEEIEEHFQRGQVFYNPLKRGERRQ